MSGRGRLGAGVVVASFLLGLGAAPALADCVGSSVFFGNLRFSTILRLDLADPAAFYHVYIFEDPGINEGAASLHDIAFDVSGIEGRPPRSAVVFGDWAAGLGMRGCPLSLDADGNGSIDDEAIHQVFVFGDSRGTTLAVAAAAGNAFDLDGTLPGGGALSVATLRPTITAAGLTADGHVVLDLAWDEPPVNADAVSSPLAQGLVSRYEIVALRATGSTRLGESVLADLDGDPDDLRARVAIPREDCVHARVVVQARLAAADGTATAFAFRGLPSVPIPLYRTDELYPGEPGVLPDADGDNFADCDDCDDTRWDIHPGATEVCDGVDNDCSGRVDDPPGEPDSDADGPADVCDNCALHFNPAQADLDGDREGDACDLDDGEILFTDVAAESLVWQREPAYETFNLYRGDVAVLRETGEYTQDPATIRGAAQQCGLLEASAGDAFVPEPGEAVFFLATGVAGGIESSLGMTSSAVERRRTRSCLAGAPSVHLLSTADPILDSCNEVIRLDGLLLDVFGAPLEGFQVTFEVASSSPADLDAFFSPASSVTDASGSYATDFVLSAHHCIAFCVGPPACSVTVRATAAGLQSNSVTITDNL